MPSRPPRRSRAFRAILPGALLALLATSCSRPPPATTQPALHDSVTRGPLTATIEVQPAAPRVGDTLTVHLAVVAPDEYLVELPPAAQFGELNATEQPGPESVPGEAGVTWRRTFLIETGLSGPLEIPALTITYRHRSAGDSQPVTSELVARGLSVPVATALAAGEEPTTPRDITGPLSPPVPPVPLWVWLAGGAALAAAVIAGVILYRAWRARALRPAPPLPPEVRALRALRELEESGWIAAGRAREFYYRLTEIIRQYIEEKFGLAAPDMTTEEFLATLARHSGALPYDRARLQAFLEACDFVKYAALEPRPADATAAVGTARAFVDATAAAQAQPAPHIAAAALARSVSAAGASDGGAQEGGGQS